jgi:hypothetical protein
MTTQFFGVYRGIVEDIKDPENRRRLKVSLPALLGEEKMWAEPCIQPGLQLMPEVGDIVWVEFEAGDPSLPVWIGALYGKGMPQDQAR